MMGNYYFFLACNICAPLLAVAAGMYRFKELDRAARFVMYLALASALTETLAYWSAVKFQNNIAVYNFYGFVEFVLKCLFFNYALVPLWKHRAGYKLAILGLLAGIANALLLQPMDIIQTNFIALLVVVGISLSLILFYLYIFKPEQLLGKPRQLFALTCIMITHSLLSYIHFVMYESLAQLFRQGGISIQVVVTVINILANVAIAWVFLSYSRQAKSSDI